MEFHPYASIFPMCNDEELAGIVEDMRANGYDQSQAIVTYDGKILDGRNRFTAAKKAGVEPCYRDFSGDASAALEFVMRTNLHRRHLDKGQSAFVGLEYEKHFASLAKERQKEHGGTAPGIKSLSQKIEQVNEGKAAAKAAAVVGTNRQYISDAKKIRENAPELEDEVMAKKMSLPEAVKTAALPAPQRAEVIERVKAGEKATDAIREIKRAEIVSNLESIETKAAKAASGVYDVIVIDPPWPMQKIERDVAPNQSEFDYPTMTLDEIGAMEIPAADACHLFCWTTQKFLPDTLEIIKRWGFKYVLCFVWHKPGGFQPFGLPQYNCEFAVYARKGTPEFVDFKDFPTCFNAPRGGHSEKPEQFYELLRRVTAGRRLDMFNRRQIEGFDTWGNQAHEQ
jgi:N6-adenosine-specific RNA methylase IME4/ParB-like chromosome segregation protein Spo0J